MGNKSLHPHDVGKADTAGYRLVLTIPTSGAAADGSAENVAEAKLTLSGQLQPNQPITFKITQGSAVFSNGLQQIDGQKTSIMGRAEVSFTDKTGEQGEMVAWMTNNEEIKSDAVPYTFVAARRYDLALSSLTPDGESADGEAENEGRAVVTYGGGVLEQAQVVKFEFEGGSASFDTHKPYVQPNSSGSTLYVQTHNENGQDIADAYFTDTQAQPVTLKASLRDHAEVAPQTQDFVFVAPPSYALALNSLTPNGANADGNSENAGRAIVTYGGGALDKAQVVKFEFQGGSADFDTSKLYVQPGSDSHTLYVQTHSESGQDIADAYFADSEKESVTLVASLVDHPQVPPETQTFEFVEPPPPPPPPRYKVTITEYPPEVDDESSGAVSGTVTDTQTGDPVTGRCAVGCGGYLNGPDHVDAVSGNFGFSVYGAYLSRGFVSSPLTVSYEDGRDTVQIDVVPPFAE